MTLDDKILRILLGGSLKKYNRIDLNGVFVWIILPILLFLFSMNAVYAYFTATTTSANDSVTTAKIVIGFKDTATSTESTTSSGTTSVVNGKVVPGDTLVYSGKIVNNGTIKLYAVLEFVVTITGETTPLYTNYYTATGTKLEHDGTKYITGATIIDTNATSSFSLRYTVPTDFTLEDYKDKSITMIITAHAIQFANVGSDADTDDAVEATNLLLVS